jgi:hypothetical protein
VLEFRGWHKFYQVGQQLSAHPLKPGRACWSWIIPKVRTVGKFTYRKRTFLNPVSSGLTSFILAEVESSADGSYRYGHYMLTLADCRRQIQIEFFLGTAQDRKQSLKKIDLMLEVLTAFRGALAEEARLISEEAVAS